MKSKIVKAIEELREQGFKIKYRHRSDGGVLVFEINGVKYKAAKGNQVVRTLTATQMSQAELKQRESALRQAHPGKAESGMKKGKAYIYKKGAGQERQGKIAIKAPRLTKEQRKALRRINAKLRKMKSRQKIGARQLRRRAKEEHRITASGEIEESFIREVSSQSFRRAAGEASLGRVEWFIEWGVSYFQSVGLSEMARRFESMVTRLYNDPSFLWNEWAIQSSIDMVYKLGKRNTPVELSDIERELKRGSEDLAATLKKEKL